MDNITFQLGSIQPEKTIPPGSVFVPSEIEVRDGFLHWSLQKLRFKEVKPRMLNTFAELHRKDDAAILTFAKQWGIFGICKHGVPAPHLQKITGPWARLGIGPCALVQVKGSPMYCKEPLSKWSRWSSACDATLQIAASLNNDSMPEERGRDNCWDRLIFGRARLPSPEILPGKKDRLVAARGILESEVNKWLRHGSAGPRFTWNSKSRQWDLSLSANAFPNLFGSLAMALALTVSGSTGVAPCSACGGWFAPGTRPNPERNRFCSRCRSGPKMWATLKRQQRAKAKALKEDE